MSLLLGKQPMSERLLHNVYQKVLQPSVKTSAVAIISASLPFLGLRLPSEMRVKGQPLSPDYWDHMRVTESGIYGVGHVSFTLQLSQIPLRRPGLSWLAGVSNDLRSEVVSQRKHTGLAQLQADLTSPRTARFGKRFRCLLKTDVMRFNSIWPTAPLCPLWDEAFYMLNLLNRAFHYLSCWVISAHAWAWAQQSYRRRAQSRDCSKIMAVGGRACAHYGARHFRKWEISLEALSSWQQLYVWA